MYSPSGLHAQTGGKVLLSGIIFEGDTLPHIFMDEVIIAGKLPKKLAKEREKWNKLKYNVWKVYPYAVVAGVIMKDVDTELERLKNDRKGRKAYLDGIEKQLKEKFKGELENLSISQGQVLVKLISRQTGKNCFYIIKEMKTGFSAVVWQSVALLFNNNLKRDYDPQDRDKEIEEIVLDLEAQNYYRYKYEQQQKKAAQARS